MRTLVVNADDLGLSLGINRGIARAHDEGIVSSASLMVRRTAAPHGVALARDRPSLGVGLHIDLGEWEHRGGEWVALYQVVDVGNSDAVRAEVRAQLRRFRWLTGEDPTHLDSHQHVHRAEPVAAAVRELATQLGVPVRGDVRHEGSFYGQSGTGDPLPDAIAVGRLVALLGALPEGWTELSCHPGEGERYLCSAYATERERELAALCNPAARATIRAAGVRLENFRALRGATELTHEARQ